MSDDLIPWERVAQRGRRAMAKPRLLVDLRRCIGCHACSVACKVEHNVPLGVFRMRVRWLPRPDRPGISFVPVFDPNQCDLGASRGEVDLDPACVSSCPTAALRFGDAADPEAPVVREAARHGAKPLPGAVDHASPSPLEITYIGLEPWHPEKLNAGVPLSAEDEDIIYEQ
ncbi:MAG: hypothetical protein AAF928_15675 [Myxococcota bacterium]